MWQCGNLPNTAVQPVSTALTLRAWIDFFYLCDILKEKTYSSCQRKYLSLNLLLSTICHHLRGQYTSLGSNKKYLSVNLLLYTLCHHLRGQYTSLGSNKKYLSVNLLLYTLCHHLRGQYTSLGSNFFTDLTI